MIKLRDWQTRCVKHALNIYQSQSHFLCLATPGAGKTVMASELAMRLYEQNKIDFILCFSPSTEVNESIQQTFSNRFKRQFNGLIGAIGGVYTYQSMPSLSDEVWKLIRSHNVFVIMDEIHHLKGTEVGNANAWGEEVLINIQKQARYTLALSGTPWRSDNAPIVLSTFTEPDNTIHCDFIYGLKEAIADGVCREPKIVLIDNNKINLESNNLQESFSSIEQLLSKSKVSFQGLITHPKIMEYMLGEGVNKLNEIREHNPKAGGLVIATSIQHAKQLHHILVDKLKQTASIVTSKVQRPSLIIDNFRRSKVQWIVSVGMVSEGTDIPRLQVCCHLSRIKTEMHYRQVLGRILRVTDDKDQQAWLFTLAEKNLTEFAYRINEDLPEKTVVFEKSISDELDLTSEASYDAEPETTFDFNIDLNLTQDKKPVNPPQNLSDLDEENLYNLTLLGGFKEKIVKMFDAHFLSN
ncbi:DEAD/DEAH box helicase family protein [Shewanella sp. S1-49-MNA-CIBAN-0167]|uniref:DEAD/DEAH box helicase n=1 Tax=Shewanella sp. S1-49-MNA-CIBAN-0167 TaxID=3140468 RepID=UPI00331AC1B7